MTSFMALRKRTVWVLFPLRSTQQLWLGRKCSRLFFMVSTRSKAFIELNWRNYPNIIGVLKTMLSCCLREELSPMMRPRCSQIIATTRLSCKKIIPCLIANLEDRHDILLWIPSIAHPNSIIVKPNQLAKELFPKLISTTLEIQSTIWVIPSLGTIEGSLTSLHASVGHTRHYVRTLTYR